MCELLKLWLNAVYASLLPKTGSMYRLEPKSVNKKGGALAGNVLALVNFLSVQ